jgi:CRISPR-associated protein Cas2
MVVLIVEDAKPALRGLLSRWLIEPRAGVFVGRLSARVRDRLWERVANSGKVQGALLIHGAQNEQGFAVRSCGDTSREPVDFEGLTLIRCPKESKTHREHYRKRGHEEGGPEVGLSPESRAGS